MEHRIIVGTLMFAIVAMAIGMWEPWPMANPDAAFSLGAGASLCPALRVLWRLFADRSQGRIGE